jgi:hypothetical protein
MIFDYADSRTPAFKKQTLKDFINKDVFYLGIYGIELSTTQIQLIKRTTEQHAFKNYPFDYDFRLDNDAYYCSEWCYQTVKDMFPEVVKVYPIKTVLNNEFLEAYLERKALQYIPVDFFLDLPGVALILEQHYE